MTDASATIYSPECGGWFLPNGTEVCGISTISLLRKSIGIPGLVGVYKLLSFRIVNELQTFLKFYGTIVRPYAVLMEQVRDTLYPTFKNPPDPARLYAAATKKTEKLMLPTLICLRRVGQCQLLLKLISSEVHFRSKLDANLMHSSLANLSASVVNDVRAHYRDPSKVRSATAVRSNRRTTPHSNVVNTPFFARRSRRRRRATLSSQTSPPSS